MATQEFKVEGMTCGGCERSIQNVLTKHAGVVSAKADHVSAKVSVEFDPAQTRPQLIAQAITDAGFDVVS